ncbi:MAG TPA: DUF362 domain-containing protein [Candidatus Hydrogenedens sp.]|mgnify:CR=1 FL=1|nr:DUF362 domain-containing protein [Candidatus Hydrogenedens sp.]HOK10424.1 DUF362 domain-containing protein [Candidatus Hydrogenedens sp.]
MRTTRRTFLSMSAMGTAYFITQSIAQTENTQPTPQAGEKSRVVVIRDKDLLDTEDNINKKVLEKMVDEGVKTLFQTATPEEAWKKIIKPDDVVGIKSNVSGPPRTPVELEDVLKMKVMAVGVPADKVSVDDRGVLRNPVFQNSTALINTRPMRTHHWSGVGSLLKNYLMFSDKPPSWHADSCANLAGLWDLPIVKGKTRLNILVMITPLFHGKGPHHYNKEYTWNYQGLVIGTDPVACDATGLRILKAKRLQYFGSEQPFAVSPHHIQVAQDKFHLGNADENRIELIKLGWEDGFLI